jgi:hypothetical protein
LLDVLVDKTTPEGCAGNAREMSGSGLSPGLLVGGHVE